VKLRLEGGEETDILAVTTPAFIVKTPEEFLELLRLREPDSETGQPDMEKLGAFLGKHPEAGPAVQEQLESRPPVSYATTAYNSLHAYKLIAPDGTERWVRWHFHPEAGEATIDDDDEVGALDRDYLQQEIAARLEGGPVAFVLQAAVAADGDPIDDPTQAWPDQRETLDMGRLEITAPTSDRDRDGDVLVFDPTRVADGVELSADPILHVRADVYAESVFRRSGARREA
jgi:catalase